MNLMDIRQQIDAVDADIMALFLKRMSLCAEVAEYKRENSLPVFQGGREEQIIERIRSMAPEELKDGAQCLFTGIMDISKCLQQQKLSDGGDTAAARPFIPEAASLIACQGRSGAYSHEACEKLFPNKEIRFFESFDEVFSAVEAGKADFGILPIMNSSRGSVWETYELMKRHSFYVNSVVQVEVSHCLAAKTKLSLNEIGAVYSHPQALMQCSSFLAANSLSGREYINTALAAEYVSRSDSPSAAICSVKCAERLGLEIIADNIADFSPNYTRFICISKDFLTAANADTISVSLAIPHTKSSLYRLLTKFSVYGLNLKRIESMPVGNDFEVLFYLDFDGKYDDERVATLLSSLRSELSCFRFLGNYNTVI